MANKNLNKAKKAKNDEFYTLYHDIEKEISAYIEHNKDVFKGKVVLLPCDDPEWSNFTKYFVNNFKLLGLKKLISTSYSPQAKGKILSITDDANTAGWEYLTGDGDFRSDEVKALRDEADIIVTNPPFSLFRELIDWVFDASTKKEFILLGNVNAITYKNVFPRIKDNLLWLGYKSTSGDVLFRVPENNEYKETYKGKREVIDYFGEVEKVCAVPSICWFTNMPHAKRNEPMPLMSMKWNIKNQSKAKNLQKNGAYQKYDNYDAIEIPKCKLIPSDYHGIMGVPISFLNKYYSGQFEILGITDRQDSYGFRHKKYTREDHPKFNDLNRGGVIKKDGQLKPLYARILIKHKNPVK